LTLLQFSISRQYNSNVHLILNDKSQNLSLIFEQFNQKQRNMKVNLAETYLTQMQLFLVVGSIKSQRFTVESLSLVGVVLVAGEDETTADAKGSVDGEGLGCESRPAGERRLSCQACSANRRASSGLQE
jgi:hypothetical protein